MINSLTSADPQASLAVQGQTGACALQSLLGYLAGQHYRFITPTPLTHSRVLANRRSQSAQTLHDIFGWSMPFEAGILPIEVTQLLGEAGVLTRQGHQSVCSIRVSSLGDDLFVHSAYPTQQDEAVFFGPDTYRFARLVTQAVDDWPSGAAAPSGAVVRVLDVGCGTGAGAVAAARALARLGMSAHLSLSDINPLALRYSCANLGVTGLPFTTAQGDALAAVAGDFDLIISNPPYLEDAAQRSYRHGGDRLGRALSVRIASEALLRLAPGGQLLMYTGVAITSGMDGFIDEMKPALAAANCDWSYSEIDPDVFGEELELAAYSHIDRIAAVGLVARRKKGNE